MSANCKTLITFFFFLAELMKEEKVVLGEQKCRLAGGSGEEWAWGLWRASQHPGSLRGFNLEWFSWRARPPEPRDPH